MHEQRTGDAHKAGKEKARWQDHSQYAPDTRSTAKGKERVGYGHEG